MSDLIKVAAAIIINSNRLILIARKKEGKHGAGLWEFPGGKVEKDENEINALQREIREELGIEISDPQFFFSNTHSYPQIDILLRSYLCGFITDEIKLSDHDLIKWVRIEELSEFAFTEADIPVVEQLKSRKNSINKFSFSI